MRRLMAGRWANSYTSPALLENFANVANVGLRWSLPGGIKRIELTVRGKNKFDVFDRYYSHLGHRIAVYDGLFHQPIADGHVYEIVPDGAFVHYVAAGPWKEHFRDRDTTAYSALTTLTSAIGTALTDHVTIVSSDQSNLADMGTVVGGTWVVDANGGSFVGDIIEDFLLMSDSSGTVWDYWLVSAPFAGASLGKPIAYLAPRFNTADIDWQFGRRDVTAGGLQQSRHIWDLVRDMRTYYGPTPSAGSTYLSAETDLWTVDRVDTQSSFSSTQANQYSQMVLAIYEKAVQQQSFTLSSPYILDGSGARWPLWEVVKRGRSYMRMTDFHPQNQLLGRSVDRAQTFCVVAMDYDYLSNSLRITPDRPDARLDVMLARSAGVEEAKGEMISREHPVLSADDLAATMNDRRSKKKFKKGNMHRGGAQSMPGGMVW